MTAFTPTAMEVQNWQFFGWQIGKVLLMLGIAAWVSDRGVDLVAHWWKR